MKPKGNWNRSREYVKRRDKGMCVRCWVLFGIVTPAKEVDHLIGRAQGGDHTIDNMWALCGSRDGPKGSCHYEKSSREKSPNYDIQKPFYERIDPKTGWPYDGDDLTYWQEIIKERNTRHS